MLDHNGETDYTDLEAVKSEVREARRVLQRASLARHRRNAALDRGDGGGDLQAARTPA